jgi:hypothetical protein
MKKKLKIPKFKNENEEREFWAKTNLADYFEPSDAKIVNFPTQKSAIAKYAFLALLCLLHLTLSLFWSKDNLFYYGRVYFGWKIFYDNFPHHFFTNFNPSTFEFISTVLSFFTHRSIAFWQKVIDLVSGGLIIIFFSLRTINSKKWWLVPIIGFSSVAFWSPLISQGGEGIVSLLIVVGLYYWQQKKYIVGGLLFGLSIWFKFLFYFILPVVVIFTIYEWIKTSASRRKQLLMGIFLILISVGIYQTLDRFQDFSFHLSKNKAASSLLTLNLSNPVLSSSLLYLYAVIISFPFCVIAHKYIKANLYLFCALFALLVLSMFGFVYYYSFPIVAFLFASMFYDKKYPPISKRTVVLSALLSFLVFFRTPYLSSTRPATKQEHQKTISIINKNYQGGFVVIPLNFALEFPFKNISHDALPADKERLKQIEWIVAQENVPQVLTQIPDCHLIYDTRISELITLYRYQCNSQPQP